MNWRNYTRGLTLSTLIFGALLLILTIFTSPEQGMFTIILYYTSIFFFVMGLSSLIIFFARKWWTHGEVIYTAVKVSLRQGFLFSTFLISLFVLSSFRLLTWWDGAILAVSFVLIELFFKARR
ncbi:MAG: hypothetical protein PHW75_02260 [Patescibacteria group bacterium]|nr:hypothetical protein [Patescibacteria group bacterium]